MCVWERRPILAFIRQGDIRELSHLGKTGHAPNADMYTLVLEILQYRGQGKQNTSPPQIHSRNRLAEVCNLPMFLNLCFFSHNYFTDIHVVSTFPQEEW